MKDRIKEKVENVKELESKLGEYKYKSEMYRERVSYLEEVKSSNKMFYIGCLVIIIIMGILIYKTNRLIGNFYNSVNEIENNIDIIREVQLKEKSFWYDEKNHNLYLKKKEVKK